MRHATTLLASLVTIVTITLAIPVVYADDIEDAIQEALQAYKKQDYNAASESLDYANQLIRQHKGSKLEGYFPDPLDGWKAEKPTSAAANTAFLGGGISAERVYTKGNKRVTVSFISDSPMLQGMLMMFGNPMFATSDGGKMQRINGQKAIVKTPAGGSDGEVTMALNKMLISVKGQADEAELVAYAKKIDVNKLAAQ